MITYRRNCSARSANREAPTAIRSILEISRPADRTSRLERKQRKGHGARSKPRFKEAQRAWYKAYLETKFRIASTYFEEESEHRSHPPLPKSVLNGAVIEAPMIDETEVIENAVQDRRDQPAVAPAEANQPTSTTTAGLRQSPWFLLGKKKTLPLRVNVTQEELAKMRALTASLKKKNREKFGKPLALKKSWPSSQTVTEDVVNQPTFAPPDAEVVAPTRRANRGARAVRELTSTLNGSYWLRPSTRRAPVRS